MNTISAQIEAHLHEAEHAVDREALSSHLLFVASAMEHHPLTATQNERFSALYHCLTAQSTQVPVQEPITVQELHTH